MSDTNQLRRPAIVVGVDGSERNQAAVDWAVAEAVRARGDLRLVGVARDPSTTTVQQWTRVGAVQYSVEDTEAILCRMSRRIMPRWERVAIESPTGVAERELLRLLQRGDVLVVGRRGIGPVERAVLGGTSMAAAGRSPVPTVIVPDDWDQEGHNTWPLVAGLDGTERDDPVLEFAFRRAEALDVRLDVVGAWETPRLYAREESAAQSRQKEAETRLGERLQSWVTRFPRVDAVWSAPQTQPSSALLDEGRGAQLIILGRFSGAHHFDGFSGFSTSRRVLHHAVCPVAIVPLAREGETEPLFDDSDVPEF